MNRTRCYKHSCLFALVFLLFAAGCSQNSAGKHPSQGDYFPLALGDTWTYRMSPGTKVYEAQVTAQKVIGGINTYALAVEDTYSYLAVRPDGVYQYGQGDPDDPKSAVLFSPPQLLYQLPFDVGDEWNTPVLAEPTGKDSETVYVGGQVDSVETVTVPAGTFRDCYKLTVDDPRDSPANRTDLWFAPNVGIVKTVTYIVIGAGKPKMSTTELVKYRLAR